MKGGGGRAGKITEIPTPLGRSVSGVVRPWYYAIGAGGVATLVLYVAYFVQRFLAHWTFDVPLPTEPTPPFGPGVSIAVVFLILAQVIIFLLGWPLE